MAARKKQAQKPALYYIDEALSIEGVPRRHIMPDELDGILEKVSKESGLGIEHLTSAAYSETEPEGNS